MNIRYILICISIFFTYICIFLSGCIPQKINDIAQGKVAYPKWDVDFNIPLARLDLTPDELIFESLDINAIFGDLGMNAQLEKVNDSNLSMMSKLGFNKGDYYIKYNLPIEVPEGLFESDIADQINGITNNEKKNYQYDFRVFPIYPLNFYELFELKKKNIGEYRWPIEPRYMTFDISNDNATYKADESQDIVREVLKFLGLTLPLIPLNTSLDMTMDMNFDVNEDNSDDIKFRGIYLGDESKVILELSLYQGGTQMNQYLKAEDLSIDTITVEGRKYHFRYGERKNQNSPLVFETTDFKNGVFDLGGDPGKNYKKLNFQKIKFTLFGGDTTADRDILGPSKSEIYIKMNAKIDFGTDYSLLCDLYPMVFNLGVAESPDLSTFTKFIDKNYTTTDTTTDPKEKVINTLSSALSLSNVGFVLDISNDFVLPLDATSLFDSKITYKIDSVTGEPVDSMQRPPNGGLISYFDINRDGVLETTVPLTDSNPGSKYIIPQKSVSGPGTKRVIVETSYFNLAKFLEQNDGGNLVRPSKIKAIMTLGTAGEKDSKIFIRNFSMDNLFKMSGVFYIPISLKFLTNKGGLDLMSIMPDNTFPLTGDVLSGIPLGNLKDLSIIINGTNNLPVGMDLSFDLVTSDNLIHVPLLENGTIGLSLNQNGSLWVNSNGIISVEGGIKENFTYFINGSDAIYNGSLIDFIKEYATDEEHKLKMVMNFSFLKSSDSLGNVQSVSLVENSVFKMNINVKGTMSIDMNNLK